MPNIPSYTEIRARIARLEGDRDRAREEELAILNRGGSPVKAGNYIDDYMHIEKPRG